MRPVTEAAHAHTVRSGTRAHSPRARTPCRSQISAAIACARARRAVARARVPSAPNRCFQQFARGGGEGARVLLFETSQHITLLPKLPRFCSSLVLSVSSLLFSKFLLLVFPLRAICYLRTIMTTNATTNSYLLTTTNTPTCTTITTALLFLSKYSVLDALPGLGVSDGCTAAARKN